MCTLCRFRIRSNNLEIETGRYTKPRIPENERTCIYCTAHAIEIKSHFLLECDLYKTERDKLWDTINTSWPF